MGMVDPIDRLGCWVLRKDSIVSVSLVIDRTPLPVLASLSRYLDVLLCNTLEVRAAAELNSG